MGIFIALIVCCGLMVINLYILNKRRQAERVRKGKPAIIQDTSMTHEYMAYATEDTTGTMGING
jgi:hypothetical protein